MTSYWAEQAWLGGPAATDGVLLVESAGRLTQVTPTATAPAGAQVLRGLTLPGLANTHSHAFHRALRGRTHSGGGTFWTWREQMYAVASVLTPDTYYALARATYAEMALAGVTCVGEFHYLHHDEGGKPYASGNVMSEVLVQAATDAGVRLTLLDTCYLTGGVGKPLEGPQLRFGDGDAGRWAERVSSFTPSGNVLVGAALHSVRAVPADQLDPVVAWAQGKPLHVHLSEQVAENEACVETYGRTPAELLADHGALGPRTTAVHATHLTHHDVGLLGGSRTNVCMCPTTERDLADGIGPARSLAAAGSPLSLGSDSHAVIDLLEEARAVELDERLATQQRGHWPAHELVRAATQDGYAGLGWSSGGRLEVGADADFVTVATDTVRVAGSGPVLDRVLFAATAADVCDVVVAGRRVVSGGRHLLVDDVAAELGRAIAAVTG